jgi:hypothetical protein
MADVTIKTGDRLPVIARQFFLDDDAVNLTGANVTFNMWRASTGVQVITGGLCTVVAAATGSVEYPWSATDATLPAGEYLASFSASFAGPRILTAPNNGMIVVEILGTTEASWSYTGNPENRLLDACRFVIGDTDSTNQLLMDQEILWLLSQWEENIYTAGAEGCVAISGKFTRMGDYSKSVGDLSLSTQHQAQANAFLTRADHLRNQAANIGQTQPYFYSDTSGNVFGPSHFSVGMDTFL